MRSCFGDTVNKIMAQSISFLQTSEQSDKIAPITLLIYGLLREFFGKHRKTLSSNVSSQIAMFSFQR